MDVEFPYQQIYDLIIQNIDIIFLKFGQQMRKINSDDEEFDDYGYDHRPSLRPETTKDNNGWIIAVVIVVSIVFAYYFFDKTYEVKNNKGIDTISSEVLISKEGKQPQPVNAPTNSKQSKEQMQSKKNEINKKAVHEHEGQTEKKEEDKVEKKGEHNNQLPEQKNPYQETDEEHKLQEQKQESKQDKIKKQSERAEEERMKDIGQQETKANKNIEKKDGVDQDSDKRKQLKKTELQADQRAAQKEEEKNNDATNSKPNSGSLNANNNEGLIKTDDNPKGGSTQAINQNKENAQGQQKQTIKIIEYQKPNPGQLQDNEDAKQQNSGGFSQTSKQPSVDINLNPLPASNQNDKWGKNNLNPPTTPIMTPQDKPSTVNGRSTPQPQIKGQQLQTPASGKVIQINKPQMTGKIEEHQLQAKKTEQRQQSTTGPSTNPLFPQTVSNGLSSIETTSPQTQKSLITSSSVQIPKNTAGQQTNEASPISNPAPVSEVSSTPSPSSPQIISSLPAQVNSVSSTVSTPSSPSSGLPQTKNDQSKQVTTNEKKDGVNMKQSINQPVQIISGVNIDPSALDTTNIEKQQEQIPKLPIEKMQTDNTAYKIVDGTKVEIPQSTKLQGEANKIQWKIKDDKNGLDRKNQKLGLNQGMDLDKLVDGILKSTQLSDLKKSQTNLFNAFDKATKKQQKVGTEQLGSTGAAKSNQIKIVPTVLTMENEHLQKSNENDKMSVQSTSARQTSTNLNQLNQKQTSTQTQATAVQENREDKIKTVWSLIPTKQETTAVEKAKAQDISEAGTRSENKADVVQGQAELEKEEQEENQDENEDIEQMMKQLQKIKKKLAQKKKNKEKLNYSSQSKQSNMNTQNFNSMLNDDTKINKKQQSLLNVVPSEVNQQSKISMPFSQIRPVQSNINNDKMQEIQKSDPIMTTNTDRKAQQPKQVQVIIDQAGKQERLGTSIVSGQMSIPSSQSMPSGTSITNSNQQGVVTSEIKSPTAITSSPSIYTPTSPSIQASSPSNSVPTSSSASTPTPTSSSAPTPTPTSSSLAPTPTPTSSSSAPTPTSTSSSSSAPTPTSPSIQVSPPSTSTPSITGISLSSRQPQMQSQAKLSALTQNSKGLKEISTATKSNLLDTSMQNKIQGMAITKETEQQKPALSEQQQKRQNLRREKQQILETAGLVDTS